MGAGRNVLAVEVHQVSTSSSDLAFELRLTATRPLVFPPPRLRIQLEADRLRLAWGGNAGPWVVESSPAVTGAPWIRATDHTVGESEGWVLNVPQPNGPRFYRLVRP